MEASMAKADVGRPPLPGSDLDPESMPELTREILMLKGALDGIQRRAGELAHKLNPITKDGVPRDSERLTKVDPPCSTTVTAELSEIRRSIGLLEEFLADLEVRVVL